MSKFIREVSFTPAWDKTDPNPSKDYGVHGVDLIFKLKCPEEQSTLTFVVYSGWMLPHVYTRWEARGLGGSKGMGAEVCLHKLALNDQPHDNAKCDFVGGPCKVTGNSYSLGNDFFNLLVAEGSDALWARMEETYENWSKP